MYKITFNMTSPICYMTLPIFDSILAYVKYISQRKITDIKTPSGIEIDNIEVPLIKHKDYDFYLDSYMFSDHVEEGLDAWRKRWDGRHDFLANFGKAKRRINIASGHFKSYDIPVITQSARQVWFYFEGDEKAVSNILENLIGIGKKSAYGFGWFSEYRIEEVKSSNLVLCRPLPVDFLTTNLHELDDLEITFSFGSWHIPYWKAEDQQKIVIPKGVSNEKMDL